MQSVRAPAEVKSIVTPLQQQGIFASKSLDIQSKLNAALRYVIYTCVIGASNKMDDLEKTNGWSLNQFAHYEYWGEYVKNCGKTKYKNSSFYDGNAHFDQTKKEITFPVSQWYFKLISEAPSLSADT